MGFIAFIFVGMTAANRILEGAFINTSDVAALNTVTVFRSMELFGLFTIPIPNFQFLDGLFHLVKFDQSYFGGNAGFIQYFMYSISFVVACIAFTIIVGLLANYFMNRTR